jgi:predicted ribosomally synthesized peptide with nif11-like leader
VAGHGGGRGLAPGGDGLLLHRQGHRTKGRGAGAQGAPAGAVRIPAGLVGLEPLQALPQPLFAHRRQAHAAGLGRPVEAVAQFVVQPVERRRATGGGGWRGGTRGRVGRGDDHGGEAAQTAEEKLQRVILALGPPLRPAPAPDWNDRPWAERMDRGGIWIRQESTVVPARVSPMSLEQLRAFLARMQNDEALKQQVLAAATADDVAQIGLRGGYEFSGDELLRVSGQRFDRVTVRKNDLPGEYN